MFFHFSYPKVFGTVISMLCLSAAGQEISPDANLSKKDERDLESVRKIKKRMDKQNNPIPLEVTLPEDGGKIEKVVLGFSPS